MSQGPVLGDSPACRRRALAQGRDCSMRKWLFAVAAVALGVVGSAQPAAAAAPTRQDINVSDSVVLTDVCPFPVTVSFTVTGTVTTFTDRNGIVTRVEQHSVEQDVFTANDATL